MRNLLIDAAERSIRYLEMLEGVMSFPSKRQ